MTQRRFFFIFIIRSKGRERKGGGRMIAVEFDNRSPAQVRDRPNDHKSQAGCLSYAGGLSAHIVSRGHPESLT
jgi:hypothetical protein